MDRPQWHTLKAYLDDSSCTQIGPLSSTNETATAVDSASYAGTVAVVYRDYLGRDADQAGPTFWSTQMANGSMNLAGVINAIMGSAEYRNRMALERLYQSYIGRSADSARPQLLVRRAMTINSIAAALIGSTEYQGNLQKYGQSALHLLSGTQCRPVKPEHLGEADF